MKVLDPQVASGGIIIPGGDIRDRIKSAKAEAEKLGVLSLLYLKVFCCTEKTKILTYKLYRDYIQELITLRDLKNNCMSRGEVIGLIQIVPVLFGFLR